MDCCWWWVSMMGSLDIALLLKVRLNVAGDLLLSEYFRRRSKMFPRSRGTASASLMFRRPSQRPMIAGTGPATIGT